MRWNAGSTRRRQRIDCDTNNEKRVWNDQIVVIRRSRSVETLHHRVCRSHAWLKKSSHVTLIDSSETLGIHAPRTFRSKPHDFTPSFTNELQPQNTTLRHTHRLAMADRGGAAPRGGAGGERGGFGGRGGGDRGRGGRGRGRGRRGGAKSDEKEWQPVTKLGRLVKAGKIKSMEEIYLHSLPIKEFQIVDFFLPKLKDEVMKVRALPTPLSLYPGDEY